MYAIAIRPLIDILSRGTDPMLLQQAWFADDSSGAGKLREIKKWWDILNEAGPKFGYFPKPSKTILIVKTPTTSNLQMNYSMEPESRSLSLERDT